MQAPYGIMLPLAEADGAIRARFHFLPGTVHPQFRIRSSGTPATKNEKFYMLLFRASEKTTAITKFEVNLTAPNNAGKGLGTATLSKPLELGGHIDLEFSMIGNRLQVLINGKPAFHMENDFIPGPGDCRKSIVDSARKKQPHSLPAVDHTDYYSPAPKASCKKRSKSRATS